MFLSLLQYTASQKGIGWLRWKVRKMFSWKEMNILEKTGSILCLLMTTLIYYLNTFTYLPRANYPIENIVSVIGFIILLIGLKIVW